MIFARVNRQRRRAALHDNSDEGEPTLRQADGVTELIVYRSRIIGLVLIAVVLCTVAFSPQLRPQAVPGEAVAVPVPGPPAVGLCVPKTGTTPWNPEAAGLDQSGTHRYVYPQLVISQCVGARYGEVAAVIAHPTRPAVTVGADGTITALTDSNMDDCSLAALTYIGSPSGGPRLERTLSFWYVLPSVDSVASRPSVLQEAAGQHWLACIVFLQQNPDSGGRGDLPPSYRLSLRDALATGYDHDQLGTCDTDVDVNDSVPTVCSAPHRVETFGVGSTGKTVISRARLSASCSRLISRLTRLSDITAHGALAVQLQITDSNGGAVTAAHIPANSQAVCGINATAGRRLAGSLLAIGAHPIPWAA